MILIIIVVVGDIGFFIGMKYQTDNAVIEGGMVISPKVAGYVKTLNITDNQVTPIKVVLLEIDSTDYLIKRTKLWRI